MKTFLYSHRRGISLLIAAIILSAIRTAGQTAAPNNPRDPLAYQPGGVFKPSGAAPVLLSTVHYTVRQDTLSPYDSSRITWNAAETRIAELRNFRWDAGRWGRYDRYTYQFNSSGLNDQTIYEFWNQNKGSYVPVARYNYAHDGAGNKTQLFYEVYNQLTGSYGNGQMIAYSYDAGGNLTGILQQTWAPAGSAWENNTRESMSYNARGKETTYTIESWSFSLNAWEQKRQTLTGYDASGMNLVRQEFFTWGGPSLGWLYKSRLNNTLSGGNVVRQLIDDYDLANNKWLPLSQESRTYLASGELATSTMASWYAPGATYQDQSRATYAYTKYNHPGRVSIRVPQHGSWVVGTGAGETIYYYKDEPALGSPAIIRERAELAIAPVPANATLHISMNNPASGTYRLGVSDVCGRTVISTEIVFNATVPQKLDLQNIPAGSYLLRLDHPGLPPMTRRFEVVR